MKRAAVVFLRRDGQLFIPYKLRGFGMCHLQGVGGKQDPGETIVETAVRETFEEVGVPIYDQDLSHFATLRHHERNGHGLGLEWVVEFYFSDLGFWIPVSSPEIEVNHNKHWFDLNNLPYPRMLNHYKHWMPGITSGEAKFVEIDVLYEPGSCVGEVTSVQPHLH